MTKRKRYSAESKAKVALEAIREELTTAELCQEVRHPPDDDQRLERDGDCKHGVGIWRSVVHRADDL